MIGNLVKSAALLAGLSGILLLLGALIGGRSGLTFALIMALVMNGIAYYFSDKIVLSMYGAKQLDQTTYGWIYDITRELSTKMQIPMPKLWLINTPMANAFATGRNPENASVAVTAGILQILDEDELRGVLAHELSHVKNRDILVTTLAAVLATAIGYLANMMQYMAMWDRGGSSDNQRKVGPIGLIISAIVMPMAATLIQLALSRTREYMADESGAYHSHEPLALASALEKIQGSVKQNPHTPSPVEATTSPLFIVQPFIGGGLMALFATHPPVAKRVERLRKIAMELR